MSLKLSSKRIFVFWYPLLATWLMMAFEGPFIAAIIARLPEPKYNLAAYGVSFAFALIVEAPVIMMLSASTALVTDGQSFFKLRRFTYALNLVLTVLMLVLLIPANFYFLTNRLMELPLKVSRLTYHSLWILLPWPAAIGYRRFYQGLLIRHNLTRRVAYGTMIRLGTMTSAALCGALIFKWHGAYVGAFALSSGVTMEAVASRLMTLRVVRAFKREPAPSNDLSYKNIIIFYYPLALTSLIALAVQPLVTFFVGQSRMALESLAVLPVVNSLVFIFRSFGLSYQEVSITFLGERNQGLKPLARFAAGLMIFVTAGMLAVGFTPLHDFWFGTVSGLSAQMVDFARAPVRILVLLPALTVLLSFQRAILVTHKRTQPITVGTVLEVSLIAVIMWILIERAFFIGAVAAALAMLLGRLGCNTYLIFPVWNTVKRVKSFNTNVTGKQREIVKETSSC